METGSILSALYQVSDSPREHRSAFAALPSGSPGNRDSRRCIALCVVICAVRSPFWPLDAAGLASRAMSSAWWMSMSSQPRS